MCTCVYFMCSKYNYMCVFGSMGDAVCNPLVKLALPSCSEPSSNLEHASLTLFSSSVLHSSLCYGMSKQVPCAPHSLYRMMKLFGKRPFCEVS